MSLKNDHENCIEKYKYRGEPVEIERVEEVDIVVTVEEMIGVQNVFQKSEERVEAEQRNGEVKDDRQLKIVKMHVEK